MFDLCSMQFRSSIQTRYFITFHMFDLYPTQSIPKIMCYLGFSSNARFLFFSGNSNTQTVLKFTNTYLICFLISCFKHSNTFLSIHRHVRLAFLQVAKKIKRMFTDFYRLGQVSEHAFTFSFKRSMCLFTSVLKQAKFFTYPCTRLIHFLHVKRSKIQFQS